MPPTRLSRPGAILLGALLALSAIGFILFTCKLWNYTVDDAYITFRYAQNLVHGWGLTFNTSLPRAEGYTSVLWTLLMAVPQLAGIDPVLFAKGAGLLLALGTLGLVVHASMTDSAAAPGETRLPGAAFAAILYLSFSSAPVHGISGMETALAAFLYVGTAALFLRSPDANSSPWLPAACLLLGLTRPEANLFAAVLLGLVLVRARGAERRSFALACVAAYVIPGIVYFVWRFRYYGVPMPLPFYIKSNGVRLSGLEPTLSFLKNIAVGFALPVFSFATLSSRRRAWILVPIACMIAYFVTTEHIMGYGHRYFFPLVPVLALIAGLGFSARLRAGAGVWMQAAFLMALALAFTLGNTKTLQVMPDYLSYEHGMETAHVPLGRALAAVRWSAPPVLAIGDAGAVPYYSGLRTIDTYGLNDPTIARHLHADRSAYVLAQDPDVLVFISRDRDDFHARLPHEDALWRASRAAGYDRHVTLPFDVDYELWVAWASHSRDASTLEPVLYDLARRSRPLGSVPEVGPGAAMAAPPALDDRSPSIPVKP